jgi:lipopolysaccharide transport system ATP-binding protein
MRPIIRIQGLGKRYKIGERVRYGNLRESITDSLTAPVRALRSLGRRRNGRLEGKDGHIWALRDVTFDIMPGEVVGVIGRNGAGKSTLLKILSRITEPTTGRVDLYGRVGSLLEVGTGFHPELSGRENTYLSAAILGMRRAEIDRKFDEIVAFAEMEKFVETPVKHYSSGMYVRLAFAVAAHLEPEILMVDEVLAVGDQAFQNKCLGKIGEVARGGRTVIFVSHNLPSIEALCTSCLLLHDGRLKIRGAPGLTIARYLTSNLQNGSGPMSLGNHQGRRQGSVPTMTAVQISSAGNSSTSTVKMGSSFRVRVTFSSPRAFRPVLGMGVKTALGAPVFNVSDRFARQLSLCEPCSEGIVECSIDPLPLMPGKYFIDLWLGDLSHDIDVVFDAISFEVTPADLLGSGHLPPSSLGPVFCPAQWSLDRGTA